jgi:hypothetical protein
VRSISTLNCKASGVLVPNEIAQRGINALNHAVPFARLRLAEQASGWVPGAVVVFEQPRQSGTKGSNTHTGFPSAPARSATLVSTEITKSRSEITEVSFKPSIRDFQAL